MNIFIEIVISVAVYCKSMEIYGESDSRQGKAYVFINLQEMKIWNIYGS